MLITQNMYLSAKQCQKKYWYQYHERIVPPTTNIQVDKREILDLAVQWATLQYPNSTIASSKKFTNNNISTTIDLLVHEPNLTKLILVSTSIEVQQLHKEKLAYQLYLLEQTDIRIDSILLLHVNSKYIRKGDIDLDALFVGVDLTKEIDTVLFDVNKNLATVELCQKADVPPTLSIGLHCKDKDICPFFSLCTELLPTPNIFEVRNMRFDKKINLYNEGIVDFPSLLETKLTNIQRNQIEFTLYHKNPMIKSEEVRHFLDTFTFPLYFLDFETFNPCIPPYELSSPYEQLVFQYSLHILSNKEANLEHFEHIGTPHNDPRRNLAEQLIKNIGSSGSVVTYNQKFEKLVLKSLAKHYPDLSEQLYNIHDRIVDLMVPFQKQWVYYEELKGSYSIKQVLPTLFPNQDELNYTNLKGVNNGLGAIQAFQSMLNCSASESEILKQQLLRYCELDTFAMVKVWQELVRFSSTNY